MKSNEVEEKIKTKVYPRLGVATAVVKRANFTRVDKARLIELAKTVYTPKSSEVVEPDVPLVPPNGIDNTSAYPLNSFSGGRFETASPSEARLEQQLLLIAFRLLGLCIEHKLSREDMYQRLEARLKAGMG